MHCDIIKSVNLDGVNEMEDKNKNTFMDDVVEISVSLAIGYAISRFVKVALARGESMVPTINHNQLVLIDRRAYKRRDPRQHDLVAFNAHVKGQHKFFLKRVIGTEGDTIKIENHRVYVNEEQLEEPYLNETMIEVGSKTWTVPTGKIFVMGDNRNHSLDSRGIGFIDIEKDVLGVVKQLKK